MLSIIRVKWLISREKLKFCGKMIEFAKNSSDLTAYICSTP
ncbi:hypothetical protein HPSD74_0666 [Glaesserella parasuis D74]|nr:hypothetical protein HPSSW114_0410 [Glaesserella parasuis SW114]EQA10962.1 hypothetical protein HPSD74_0666 [Glaesserella parasuis D74]